MSTTITLSQKEKTETSSLQPLPGIDTLGFGYDITGRYANPLSLRSQIIDFGIETKSINILGKEYSIPSSIPINVHPLDHSDYNSVIGHSLSEYRSNLNTSTKIEGNYDLFSGSLNVDFSESQLKISENEFSTIRYQIQKWSLSIGIPDIKSLPILDIAQKDIDGLTSLTPDELFRRYGTHFVYNGIIGGRLDYSNSTSKLNFNYSSELGLIAKLSYEGLVGSISGENATKYSKEIHNFNESSQKEVHTTGGATYFDAAIANGEKGVLDKWAKTVDDQAVLIDFSQNSLIPIWELCTKEDRKKELLNYYPEYIRTHSKVYPTTGPIIEVTYTPNLIPIATDDGSGADRDLKIYKPAISEGYYWVGQYGQSNYHPPTKDAIVIKSLIPGAVKPPIRFVKVWDDSGSGNDHDFSCWRPIPPIGYVALGYLMRLGVDNQNPPSEAEIDGFVCVPEEIVADAKVQDTYIWSDRGSGSDKNISIFPIIPADDHGVTANTFYGQPYRETHHPNPTHPPVYCLNSKKITIKN